MWVSIPYVQENKIESKLNQNGSWCNWGRHSSFFSYIRNDLHLRVCRRNAITNAVMLSCVRRRMLDVWECNHVRHLWGVIIPNHFDDRLWLRHFRMTKPTFEMLCNESGPLVSPVIHSMICWGKSFFYVLSNLFCKCDPLYMSSSVEHIFYTHFMYTISIQRFLIV